MCYNLIMLKETSRHTLGILSAKLIPAIILVGLSFFSNANAATDSEDVTFNVGINEYLSMSVSEPTTWASAAVDTFMCNDIGLSAITNNASGLVVGMTSSTTTTALTNSAASSNNTIPTLTSSSSYSTSTFPSNYWGYYSSSDGTCNTSTYYGVPASNGTPGRVLYGTAAGTYTGNVHFGAKASATKASGTYTGTVIFSAISGQNTINSNPSSSVTPASPEQTATTTTSGGAPSGTATAYTYTTSGSGKSTTTTQVSDGDNRSSYSGYSGYTKPQGVTESNTSTTASEVASGTPLAAGLAVAATAAAASGIFFFILAKRKKDDDEEDESEKQL